MTIKAVHLFENGFISQPFAFGGEDGKEAFDDQIYYRSSLQNFAIVTGSDTILVDTGLDGIIEMPPREYGAPLCMGDRTGSYLDALAKAGIDKPSVTKILVTHKHADHTDDKKAARDTLDRVRAFIKVPPTVYLTSHCPEGYESLALKRVIKL